MAEQWQIDGPKIVDRQVPKRGAPFVGEAHGAGGGVMGLAEG